MTHFGCGVKRFAVPRIGLGRRIEASIAWQRRDNHETPRGSECIAGAVTAVPYAAVAQTVGKTYRIGTLTVGPPMPPTAGTGKMLVDGLAKRGFWRATYKHYLMLAMMLINFPLAAQELLPVQISAFHEKFNEIAARTTDFADIRAVPAGCREMNGLPEGLSQCDYRLGDYSVAHLIGSDDESNAIGIIFRSRAWKGAHARLVLSSIVVIAEIAAPERSAKDRADIVRQLLRDMLRAEREAYKLPFTSQRVCRDLGGHWKVAGESGRWAISAFEYNGQLDIQVVRPLSGNCPGGVQGASSL